MKVLAVLLLAGMLAGCQTTGRVPPSLLACAVEPPPPPRPRTQALVADFTLDVVEAGRDCRSKLGQVRALLDREVLP